MQHITDAIGRLRGALGERSNVASATLYGSYVRGGFRAGVSDINLALVLRDDDLGALTAPLQEAWRAARVDPWIAREHELPRLCDVFATRVRDIQRTREMLVGDDPWRTLVVPRAALRLRVEQELRNHQMRLRRALVLSDAAGQLRQLHAAASSLRLDLELAEELAGSLDLPAADLAVVRDFRFDPLVDALAAIQRLLDRTIDIVDRLEVT